MFLIKLYLILQCNLKFDIMKLELKHLAHYLAYNLQGIDKVGNYYYLYSVDNRMISFGLWMNGNFHKFNSSDGIKPILRPLSDLTKYINYGLSTYAFVDLFEIGDCDGCVFEFEHGNIKTIKTLENISKYNSYNDINYLPNAVVNMMYEYHFDVFGLIEKNLAIDINTLNK